jgi:HAD superfamily hydrolase (TIGR01456 family)
LPIYPGTHATRKPLHEHLRVYAMFVYNDPRDWGLDTSLIVDLLLSHRGYLGTLSGLNGRSDLPNCGYQQDGQPALWFSNPDLWWAADHHLNRLGQGAFHAALRGVWHSVTDGKAPLLANVCGKPHQPTYAFAESRLVGETKSLWGDAHQPLQRVYMIGDNPMSDIMGANRFESLLGSRWSSVLVRTGVYQGGEPTEKPTAVVQDVWEAVRWALAKEGWSDVQDEAPVESSAGVA